MHSLEHIEKHVLVSDRDVTSLVKAEWGVVRSNQQQLEPDAPVALFPDSCCGILFLGYHALASNGHWLMHALTEGPALDYNVSHYFYDYAEDNVYENVNPFHDEGLDIRTMFNIIDTPMRFRLCIKPQDIKDFIDQLVPVIRERRAAVFSAKPLPGTAVMEVTIESKKGGFISDIIKLPEPIYSAFTPWSVNCSYIYKIASILTRFTDMVTLEFNGGKHDPILFRIPQNSNTPGSPLTFALGQYFMIKK